MRRLYHQFYLTIVASLVAVVLAAGALWRFAPSETPADQAFEMAGELLAAHLAPADAGPAMQQQAIDRLHARLGIDVALFATTGGRCGSGRRRTRLAASAAKAAAGFTAAMAGLAIRVPTALDRGSPARARRPVAASSPSSVSSRWWWHSAPILSSVG